MFVRIFRGIAPSCDVLLLDFSYLHPDHLHVARCLANRTSPLTSLYCLCCVPSPSRPSECRLVFQPVRLYVKGVMLGFKRGLRNTYHHTSLIKIQARKECPTVLPVFRVVDPLNRVDYSHNTGVTEVGMFVVVMCVFRILVSFTSSKTPAASFAVRAVFCEP